jgi:hypothetical protein
MNPPPHEVTDLLVAWSNGDEVARERLMAVVYQELHRLAQKQESDVGVSKPPNAYEAFQLSRY